MSERERLIELVSTACVNTDDIYGLPNAEQVADYLLENGVIVPPVKVGDTVYRIVQMSTGVKHKIKVFSERGETQGIIIPREPTIKHFIRCVKVTKNNFIDVCENFCKTVFLTKEQAEKALEEGAE